MTNSNAALQQTHEEVRPTPVLNPAPKPRLVPNKVRTDYARISVYTLENENEMNQSDPLYSPFFAL